MEVKTFQWIHKGFKELLYVYNGYGHKYNETNFRRDWEYKQPWRNLSQMSNLVYAANIIIDYA